MQMIRFDFPTLVLYLVGSIILAGCAAVATPVPVTMTPRPTATLLPTETATPNACPVTEPEWMLGPEDPAVEGEPGYVHMFVNEDRSMMASAGWAEPGAYEDWGGDRGVKVAWFRPEGADLVITGRWLDAEAPPLDSHVPCCYPTRFQSSGLIFRTKGCWEITGKAADSELSFTVYLEP